MGQNGQNGSSVARATGPCCVLWMPAGQEAPKELIASLERRQLRWTLAQDGYAAMAEILLRLRAGGPKSAVLVLVHPTKLDLSGLVVDSLARYGGPVAIWRFDAEAHPVLAAAQRHELATVFVRTGATEARAITPRPTKPTPAAPAEQSAPVQAEREAEASEHEEDEPTASSLLSEEELSMLLADRPARRL